MEDLMGGLIPILGILCAVALPIVAVIIIFVQFFTTRRDERLAMIEKGIMPQEAKYEKKAPSRLRTLRTALSSMGAGVGLIIGIMVTTALDLTTQIVFITGTVLLGFGIGYVIYYIISKDKIEKEDEE